MAICRKIGSSTFEIPCSQADLFQPPVTVTFDQQVDRFMPLLHAPLVPVRTEIKSSVFKILCFQVWYRMNELTGRKYYASGQSRLAK